MANEVNNETTDAAQAATTGSEQTDTNNSIEASAEETPAMTETQTASTDESAIEPSTVSTGETTTENQSAPAEQPAATQSPASSSEQPATANETVSAGATADAPASTEEDFGKILEKFEQEQTVYHAGDLVEGKVVGVSERGVLVDFGYKSEGIAPIEDFSQPTGEPTVQKGDTVEVIIRSLPSGDAPPMLSRLDAVTRKSWDAVEEAFNNETPITGRVVEVTKGGLLIDIGGVEAFMPGSQVESRPVRNLNQYVGQDIESKVIKFSRKRNNIVLSRKVLTDVEVNKLKSETLSNIAEGYVIEGTIKNLMEYGAFVDIGGIDGLLHVTDMAWGRLGNPAQQFKVNDTVQVKVLKLDRENEKVALGYKQLIPDPWSTVMELYPINAKVKGRVSSVAEYGAFIELEPGVEGLVHVSEMSWSKRSVSPKRLVHHGDEVEVQVLGIDTDDRRISLGMKQLQPNPWQTVHERFRVGQTVHGKVRNITDFGAFVEIEDGIDGLVHISDISHSKKIKHPKDVLKRDQDVEAIVKNIDVQNRRMSLSIKETMPSAWDAFVATHKPGDVVRGKISRFTGFGVFVELGNELEGLCHISELSDERIERPEDIGAIGHEMDFKILRIENDVQKIGLSARAVGKTDEPAIDTKSYSTEAKGGMASLGELMNLKRGGEGEEAKPDEPRQSKKERKARQAEERAEQERLAAEQAANAPQETTETEAAETASAETDSAATESETPANDEQSGAASAESSTDSNDEPTAATNSEPTAEQSTEQPTGETSEAAVDEQIETVGETGGETAEQPTDVSAQVSDGETVAATDDEAVVKDDSTIAETTAEPTASIENSETTATAENSETTDSAPTSETESADSATDSEEKTANG